MCITIFVYIINISQFYKQETNKKKKKTHQYHLEHLQVFMNSFKGQKITEN